MMRFTATFAALVISLPAIADELVAIRLARVVVKLRVAALTPGDRAAWREAAIASPTAAWPPGCLDC